MKRTFWEFVEHEGQQVDKNGVMTGYHDYISVVVRKRMALDIIETLARQLQMSDNDEEVTFNMAGLLEITEEYVIDHA